MSEDFLYFDYTIASLQHTAYYSDKSVGGLLPSSTSAQNSNIKHRQ